MVRTIMDINYEKCPFCESKHFKDNKNKHISFCEFIESTSVVL